jgi:microcystin-dependent protein
MADQFLAEIRIVGFNFAPTGWALCNGQLMPIQQNTALFSLLGTYYGGDGRTTYALPDLQGRFPMHPSQGPGLSDHFLGEYSGSSTVTLLPFELPAHSHTMRAENGTAATRVQSPAGASLAPSAAKAFHPGLPDTQLALDAVSAAGGGLPHNNLSPYLALNFCIALQGEFPARP